MREEFHPGPHPDADVLSAFMEGALAEHERTECLMHLAECARCRGIVVLAQPEMTVETPEAWWRRLFRPAPLLGFIAAALLVTGTVGFYRMIRSAEHERPRVTARADISPAAPEAVAEQVQTPVPVRAVPKKVTPPGAVARRGEPVLVPPAPAPPPLETSRAAAIAPAPPPAQATGVAGIVTDPTGGIIPNAVVELKNDATGATVKSGINTQGMFSVAGLTPGRYDMSITAPGFKKFVRPSVDVQPQEIARLDSRLEIGATTDTITINDEAPLLKTETGEISRTIGIDNVAALPVLNSVPAGNVRSPLPNPGYTLPDRSTPASLAVKGKAVVAIDAAGRLFVSEDDGKSWTNVKGKWKGKAVRVAVSATSAFELTTDPAATWQSTDGRKWSKARKPR